MKKKLIIIITIISVLSIGGGILLMNSNLKPPKKEDPKTQEKTVTEYVEKLNKVIMDGGTKQQYLSVLRRDQILNTDIMTGPDMYLRQKPSSKVIRKNSLSAYTTKGEELRKDLKVKLDELIVKVKEIDGINLVINNKNVVLAKKDINLKK